MYNTYFLAQEGMPEGSIRQKDQSFLSPTVSQYSARRYLMKISSVSWKTVEIHG